MFRALTRELAKRGYEVVVMTPRPRPPGELVQNLTEVYISPDTKNAPPDGYSNSQLEETIDQYSKVKHAIKLILNEFEQQLQTDTFREIMQRNNKYDLLIVDPSAGSPALVLSHFFNIPAVLVRPHVPYLRDHETLGSEMHAQFLHLTRNKASKMTLRDGVIWLYYEYWYRQFFFEVEDMIDEILKRNFGPDMPSIVELWENVHALLINMHWMWDNNLPLSPNIVFLGNIVQKEEKKLPEDIQTYLDKSVNGVIYLSFGSIFDFFMLPETKQNIFFDVFSKLPYDILMKCKNNFPVIPNNVRVYEWLPQTDVLNHPKIKLFITQAELHSTDEAITSGVPLLGVPIFSDQWGNAEQYVKFKIGLLVDLNQLTEERLLNAINTIVKDPSYKAATHRLRAQFERPFVPMERAVLTVERVLRSVTSMHPRPAPEHFPELPLLVAAALVLLTLLLVGVYLVKLISAISRKILLPIYVTCNRMKDRPKLQ